MLLQVGWVVKEAIPSTLAPSVAPLGTQSIERLFLVCHGGEELGYLPVLKDWKNRNFLALIGIREGDGHSREKRWIPNSSPPFLCLGEGSADRRNGGATANFDCFSNSLLPLLADSVLIPHSCGYKA